MGENWEGRRRELGRAAKGTVADLEADNAGNALTDRRIADRNMLRNRIWYERGVGKEMIESMRRSLFLGCNDLGER